VLIPASFPEDLAGWARQGEAEFSADTTQVREGLVSARITIAPGADLKWQQLRQDFPNVREGDEFLARSWVRTEGVADGTGAYVALEFVGDGDARVGIAHSKLGLTNGAQGWEELTAAGAAPAGTRLVRISLILNSHGSAWFSAPELTLTAAAEQWPDLGDAVREVRVSADRLVLDAFGGVGFHTFHHTFDWTQDEMEQVIIKRWRELAPSFVRMNDNYNWNQETRDKVASHMRYIQEDTDTTIYVTTWDPPETQPGEERRRYARNVVDQLEYWVRHSGIRNVRYYCMTNELSLQGWGKLAQDMPRFRDYHQALYDELQARNLDIKLLASDASPIDLWWTIEWATQNMDDITGVYGGHHYINDRALDDERLYPWFLEKTTWGAGLARAKGKDFILGEFGAKQDGSQVRGKLNDACIYWDTPQERFVAIQLAEAAIAAMNAGVHALGYWTYMDFPEKWNESYRNKWGTFKCDDGDFATRDIYYGFGLLTKFFRGPATVHGVTVSDPRLRVAAVHHADGAWSVAMVNRNRGGVSIDLAIDGAPLDARFRKYVYDPLNVPQHPFGDLQPPEDVVEMSDGRLEDMLTGGTLTVYTTAYDEQAPAAVSGLTTTSTPEGVEVTWDASADEDLCYYRVYRAAREPVPLTVQGQIASTVANRLLDRTGHRESRYAVVAVDKSGNAGPAGAGRLQEDAP